MKKQAKDLNKGDKIMVNNQEFVVESIEVSKLGKQGKPKCRIEAINSSGKKLVIIKLADFEFNVK